METMRPPIFVRSLSDTEKEQLGTALRSKDAFVMRRAQIILASERGERASRIARSLGCGSQTVRDAIHDFNERGLAPPSMRRVPNGCGRCSTAPRESSATTLACGRLRWPHR